MAEDELAVESSKDASSKSDEAQKNSTRNNNHHEKQHGKNGAGGYGRNKGGGGRRQFSERKDQKCAGAYSARHPNGRQNSGEVRRSEWSRGKLDKRKRNEEDKSTKRSKIEKEDEDNEKTNPFSKEEIESEERRPKRKVAVMIGYAGTGYKGMQINAEEKTIEGDIFKAFVAAGAISKANADDPKKSSFVRCARTDKGVHAAGNVISLKLIVEDNDVVQKINENLPPQIRVWGYERTNGGFSCYQSCDSRWYEYLIPSYSFLPPHPNSYLGKKLIESAKSEDYLEKYLELQEDVSNFWENAMEIHVKPILNRLDPDLRQAVMLAMHKEVNCANESNEDGMQKAKMPKEQKLDDGKTEDDLQLNDTGCEKVSEILSKNPNISDQSVDMKAEDIKLEGSEDVKVEKSENTKVEKSEADRVFTPLEMAVREVKAAYTTARKLYRISIKRRVRIQEALNFYLGTHNFHNYTVQKKFSDPSAQRVIKSFDLAMEPIIIGQTEWLSLKVHGQSFMMHQIRKMIGMIALAVRCATPLSIIQESYGPERISIPKAPGLGLLLERPVFSTYNQRAVTEFQRETLDFDKYKMQMDEFKQREIYDRIFREEESDHQFSSFFHHIDHYRSEHFLWVTSTGISAAKKGLTVGEIKRIAEESEGEVAINGEEE